MEQLEPLLVVSPHCDDGVFSCGQLIEAHPGAVVATVFAGRLPPNHPLPEWDRGAGNRFIEVPFC
ncbi:MAG: hypothetical protein ACRED0_07390 [Gammaproteobacteria bacterium]